MVLVGLKNPDLNGQYGVITGYSKGGERVMVSLESGQQGVVKVKPSHIEVVEEAPRSRRGANGSKRSGKSGGMSRSGLRKVSSSNQLSVTSSKSVTNEDIVEALEDADRLFDMADTSGDGYLSKQEFELYMQRKTTHSKQAIREMFSMMDGDRSGSITREEVQKVWIRARKMKLRWKEEEGFGGSSELKANLNRFESSSTIGDDEIFQCAADADRLFREADTSGDGVVSKREFELYMKRHTNNSDQAISELFHMMDVDNDGYITVDEVRKSYLRQNRKRTGGSEAGSNANGHKMSMAELLGVEDEELHEIADDVYNMFFLSKVGAQAFWYALIIFAIKISLFIIIAMDLLSNGISNSWPSRDEVKTPVLIAQFLLLPVAVAIEEELITTFFVYGNLKWSPVILELNPGAKKWKYHLANLARLMDGLLFLFINTILLFQAVEILSMFLNFAALMFLQTIDNVALHLARDGYLTDTLESIANDVTLMKLPRNHNESLQVLDTVLLVATLLVLVIAWSLLHFVFI